MGKSSFGIGESIGAFVLSIYLLSLMVYGLIWLISTIYKKLSESSAETEPTFHWKTSKSSYKAETTKDYNFWKKYYNSSHSKKKRTHHKKTHSYKTQRNNRSKKKEHYQKSDLKAKAFHVLNLKGNESEREIKKAYRMEVKKWHPDNNHNWYAEKRFIEIHDAYKLLLNLKKARAI